MEVQGHTSANSASPNAEVIGGPSATRSAGAYRETVGFDASGRLRFDTEPTGPPSATLVLASSLFAELQRNYRREVLLARRATEAGFRTIRFHYRGSGNSLGRPEPPDLDSMVEDLRQVLATVEGRVALIGTRVGAIAAARARGDSDVPLVLWEPVIDGRRWVEEVIRASLAREIGQGSGVTADTIRSRWRDEGVAFVLGETVPATIVAQVGDVSIGAEIVGDGPVQLVQMARNDKVKPDVARLVDDLSGRNVEAEVLPIVGKQAWWVNEGGDLFRPVERDEATRRLTDGVIDFLRRTCS